MKNGVLYAVVGKKYIDMALVSARSLLAHSVFPVAIISYGNSDYVKQQGRDIENLFVIDVADLIEETFSAEERRNNHMMSRFIKVKTMDLSPFENTLFLDSDTYVLGDVSPFFELIHASDLVVTNEPGASYTGIGSDNRPQAQGLKSLSMKGFYNSGVYGFSSTDGARHISREWVATWFLQVQSESNSEWGRLSDQKALNRALTGLSDSVYLKSLSNTKWNAQCKILRELIEAGRWSDIIILHCKLAHDPSIGPDPEKLLQTPYVRQFKLLEAQRDA